MSCRWETPSGWLMKKVGSPVSWQTGACLSLAIAMFLRKRERVSSAEEPGSSADRASLRAFSTSAGGSQAASLTSSKTASLKPLPSIHSAVDFNAHLLHGGAEIRDGAPILPR